MKLCALIKTFLRNVRQKVIKNECLLLTGNPYYDNSLLASWNGVRWQKSYSFITPSCIGSIAYKGLSFENNKQHQIMYSQVPIVKFCASIFKFCASIFKSFA